MDFKKFLLIISLSLPILTSCDSKKTVKVKTPDELISALADCCGKSNEDAPKIVLKNDIIFDKSYEGDEYLKALNNTQRNSCAVDIDGNNHAIKNLKLINTTANGIFLNSNGMHTIKNLIFENCEISSVLDCGLLFGESYVTDEYENVHIKNCKIKSNSIYAGGFIASFNGSAAIMNGFSYSERKNFVNCTIENSEVYAASDISKVGGLVGVFEDSQGEFINCKNINTKVWTGSDDMSEENGAGGLIGKLGMPNYRYGSMPSTLLQNCSNSGEIKSKRIAGGIIGLVDDSFYNHGTSVYGNLKINECQNSGNITASYYTGGIIAQNKFDKKPLMITKCSSSGKIYCGTEEGGGIIGNSKSPTNIASCTVTDQSYISTEGGGGILGYGEKTTIANCYVGGTLLGTSAIAFGCLGFNSNNIKATFVLVGQNVGLLTNSINETSYFAQNNTLEGEILADTQPVCFVAKTIALTDSIKLENICKYNVKVSGYNEGYLFSESFRFQGTKSPTNFTFTISDGSRIEFDREPSMSMFGTIGHFAGSYVRNANITIANNCKLFDNNNNEYSISKYKQINPSDTVVTFIEQ